MKNKTDKVEDVVFNICASMLRHSPEASYKRLNPALRSTLKNCMEADLPFQPDTFSRIYNELRGSKWFGDCGGSSIGYYLYSTACSLNHLSACISFENFAERPGVLWEEDVTTPARLHVGARFTWQGHYVEVTSMRKDSLVACTYKDVCNSIKGLKVGGQVGEYNDPYLIVSAKKDGKETVLHVVKDSVCNGDRAVVKRFTIPYEEIKKFRLTAKARVKAIVDRIAVCDPAKDAKQLSKDIEAEHFRHFELETINAAFARRKEWQANEGRITAWRSGVNGAWLDVQSILLRVRGDSVECSNGNAVSVAAVRRVLPVVLARRNDAGRLDLPLDSYHVDSVNTGGVKIGCTVVPWSEVDYISSRINQPAAKV